MRPAHYYARLRSIGGENAVVFGKEVKAAIETVKAKIDISATLKNAIERCKILYCHAAKVPKKINIKGFPSDAELVTMTLGSTALIDYCRLAGMPNELLDYKQKIKPKYQILFRFKQELDKDKSKIVTETHWNKSARDRQQLTMVSPTANVPVTDIFVDVKAC